MRTASLLLLVLCACSSPPPVLNDGGAGGGAGGGGGSDGGCSVACTATQVCVKSTCLEVDCTSAPCAAYQVCVSELCADRDCFGVICPAQQICARGICLPIACGAVSCGLGFACQNGSCVDVSCVGVICPADQRCTQGVCTALGCFDLLQNGTESGVDCGGSCNPCRNGEPCTVASDCQSQICTAQKICGPAPGCTNTVRDGTEVDVDCGGGSCPPCSSGHCGCFSDADCFRTRCLAACCLPPACNDGYINGLETDLDCGGDGGCARCADSKRCGAPLDCASSVCGDAGTCSAPTCADGARNGRETDVDCGGDAGCTTCAQGLVCMTPSDCMSRSCTGMRCDPLNCTDNVKNSSETDIDCGGACPPCVPPQMCLQPQDCTTGVCVAGSCRTATCTDGVRNGSELGVDCGGGCYPCGFVPPVTVPIGGISARGIVAADFDKDGKLDLATCNHDTHDVSVLLGNGNGTFKNAVQYDNVSASFHIVAAEVSGDTNLDLVVHTDPDPLGNTLQILVGNGDGTFAPPVGAAAGNVFNRTIAWGDLDSDGKLDVAMAQVGRIDLRFANGNTTFRQASIPFCPGNPNSLAVADFTSDGRPDVAAQVTAGVATPLILLIAQQADGGFPPVDCLPDGGYSVPGHTMASSPVTASLSAADVNSDGRPDLVANSNLAGLIALGQGNGGFVNAANLTGACAPSGVVAIDVNRDSGTDLVGSCYSSLAASLTVTLGQGGGTFQQVVAYPADGGQSGSAAVGDFDGDGRVDAAVADLALSRVLIFLNRF